VLTIEDDQIALPPQGGSMGFENRYIEGIGKVGEDVQLLLDAEKLLRDDEIDMVGDIASADINR
jgi:purine-binding chemotaxis protein CheW